MEYGYPDWNKPSTGTILRFYLRMPACIISMEPWNVRNSNSPINVDCIRMVEESKNTKMMIDRPALTLRLSLLSTI